MRAIARSSSKKTESQSDEDVDAPGCELDDESISALRKFFTLLDRWDRRQQEEKSKESSDDSRNEDHRDSKNNLKNLGQI